MTSNLKYTKHYIELGEPYQLVLPLSWKQEFNTFF